MLQHFIEDTLACTSVTSLFERFVTFGAHFGADVLSYHILAANLRRISFSDGFQWHTFPEEWVARYAAKNYFNIDPIIAAAQISPTPFHWYEIDRRMTLDEAQILYVADLRSHGFIDGIAVPIFGPQGGVAYFGLGSTEHLLEISEADMLTIQYGCTQVHARFLEMSGGRFEAPVPLTDREREVLQWIARGKSKSVIADILEISPHTVDTLSRRCFQKLDVHDRLAAVLRGAGLGLIQLE